MDYLSGLNDRQKEAVLEISGPVLVVAGAGSGKTKTLTHRIAHLIKTGVSPDKILAVTFTNKASQEMKERIKDLVSLEGRYPKISTFHSLCLFILRENSGENGIPKNFSILDESEAMSLIKEAIKELKIENDKLTPRFFKSQISFLKNKNLKVEELITESHNDTIIKNIWNIYEKKKRENHALDFDDLMTKTLELLESNRDILHKYQDRWDYVHVDEYQDTNKLQYKITRMLSDNNKNIFVVGDADQSIYSWRGAEISNIIDFEKDFPGAKTILLEENYRSTKNILDAANNIILQNKNRIDKNLFTQGTSGEKISVYMAKNERDEAKHVGEEIISLLDSGVKANKIAILFRANFQSRTFEEKMLYMGIPYQVLGIKFFDRKEVKDIVAYIRASMNRESMVDIKRTINYPKRGIGKIGLEKIVSGEKLNGALELKKQAYFKILDEIKEYIPGKKVSEIISFVLEKSGIKTDLMSQGEEGHERLSNIFEFQNFGNKYDFLEGEEAILTMLDEVSLLSDQDSIQNDPKSGVKLMTVHASKGLEFDHVFIVGLEEGLFPYEKEGESKKDGEEERRLFYVAVTRARKRLFLSYCVTRFIFGSLSLQEPSIFLQDIPSNLVTIKEQQESDGFLDLDNEDFIYI